MKRQTAVWLIIAALLIVIGGIMFTGVMSMLNFDFHTLSTTRFETNRYDFEETIQHIAIDTDTADLVFVPSESDTLSVECYEQENLRHTVKVENDTLMINVADTRKWYEHITFFSFETAKITLTLPKEAYNTLTVRSTTGDADIPNGFRFETIDIDTTTGDVCCDASVVGAMNLHLTTGDIRINGALAGSADLSVTTGDIVVNGFTCNDDMSVKVGTGKVSLTDVTCRSLVSDGTTGDLLLENAVAADFFSIKRTTGDVRFERCDAADISVNVTTGDVTGTLLTDKVFFAQSHTGRVDVPKTTAGGKCDITSSTGDILIDIEKTK